MQTTLDAPTTSPLPTASPANGIATPQASVAPPSDDISWAWSKVRNDPWLLPKLFVLLFAASPAVFAIGYALANESIGVAIAIIPDMLAAGLMLAGILFCTLFFDDESHA